MPKTHNVKPGEYMEIIADDEGFTNYTLIYNDALNQNLRTLRPNPHILYPGDPVVIPDKIPRQEPAQTDKKHTFHMADSGMVELTVNIRRNGKPFANRQYKLTYTAKKKGVVSDGSPALTTTTLSDHTDSKGLLKKKIPIGAMMAELTFPGSPPYTRKLDVGFLHPITVASGVQMRLNNLGFGCGRPTGGSSAAYTAALQAFQRKNQLNVTGMADSSTLDKLRSEYDGGKQS
jgi:hypothetical protein